MTSRALALAGVVLALVGCAVPAGGRAPETASGQPQNTAMATAVPQVNQGSVSVQPVSPPQPLTENGCLTYTTVLDQILIPPAQRISGMDDVFTGVIVEIGDAQWNTADSAPPPEIDYDADHVFRLVRVRVATSAKGEASGEIVVAVEGGKIGCNSFESEVGRRDLTVGQTFLWLARSEALRAKVPAVAVVHAIWVVDADGNVATPMTDGTTKVMTLDQVLKATT